MRDEELAALERYDIKLIISKLTNGTAVESNAPTLGFLLHEVARLLRRRFEQNARDFGLTRSQWQVLAYLANNEGINQSGLADLLEIEPITLGRIVDRLQARGLIERHPDPSDRRVWLLHLTLATAVAAALAIFVAAFLLGLCCGCMRRRQQTRLQAAADLKRRARA